MLTYTMNPIDFFIPPWNKLEKISGKLREYFNILIKDQSRIIFIRIIKAMTHNN